MTRLYAFDKATARKLKQFAGGLADGSGQLGYPELGPMLEASIAQSPAGGISARSGTTLGSATCDLYRIESGALVTRKQSDGTTVATATVYNLSATAVAASVYIGVVRIDGVWVCNWEDCT